MSNQRDFVGNTPAVLNSYWLLFNSLFLRYMHITSCITLSMSICCWTIRSQKVDTGTAVTENVSTPFSNSSNGQTFLTFTSKKIFTVILSTVDFSSLAILPSVQTLFHQPWAKDDGLVRHHRRADFETERGKIPDWQLCKSMFPKFTEKQLW